MKYRMISDTLFCAQMENCETQSIFSSEHRPQMDCGPYMDQCLSHHSDQLKNIPLCGLLVSLLCVESVSCLRLCFLGETQGKTELYNVASLCISDMITAMFSRLRLIINQGSSHVDSKVPARLSV